MGKTAKRNVPPLVLPAGVRLEVVIEGRAFPVVMLNRRPCTGAGLELPRRPKPPRRKADDDDGPSLFGAASGPAAGAADNLPAPIVAWAAKRDLDKAWAAVRHPDLWDYHTDVRIEPGTR